MSERSSQSSIGSYFAPAPYIRESAKETVWGANGVVIARPAPLHGRNFSLIGEQQTAADLTQYAAVLTARMNRAHRLNCNARYTLQPARNDKLPQSTAPIFLQSAAADPTLLITALAADAGVANPRLRSDQAWVGGRSPLDASLTLADTSYLPAQLDDFQACLYMHQANPSAEVAEALAYQLLTIHPLADGNGRATRALLIRLATRTRSTYPLYFAWRLMFDKRRTAENWTNLATTGKALPCPLHHDRWLEAAIRLKDACSRALAAGLDTRVNVALLFYGHVTAASIIAASPQCTPALAQKILARLATSDAQSVFKLLQDDVSTAVHEFKLAVMQ